MEAGTGIVRQTNRLSIARMARFQRPGLPIIFVTGYPSGLIDAEMGPIFLKPVDLDLLLATVHERLRVYRA
jgi:hypothetical protein